jgi:hypothetical protein
MLKWYCVVCYQTCYNGFVILNFNTSNGLMTTEVLVDTDLTEYDVNKYLTSHYPFGQSQPCYYNSNNPNNVQYELNDTNASLIAALVLLSLAGFILIIWGIIEIIQRLCKN